jgi:hypothetical protein
MAGQSGNTQQETTRLLTPPSRSAMAEAMTDIHGNPTPHYAYIPAPPLPPPRQVPFPGLCLFIWLYALLACLYVTGLTSQFPRSGWHDALAVAGLLPAMAVAACWPLVRRISTIGPLLYVLPGLALLTVPFALDFYLMYGR